jgi:hypothetical protein
VPQRIRIKVTDLEEPGEQVISPSDTDQPKAGRIRVRLSDLEDTTTTPTDKRGTEGTPPLNLLESLRQTSPLTTGREFMEGVGSGVARTLTGIRDVASKGTQYVGLGELPQVPEVLRKAGETTGEEGIPFKVGRGAETIGEYFIPGGAVRRGVQAAAKFGVIPKTLAKAGGEAISAGAVTAAQTGGDLEAAKRASVIAGLTSGAFSTLGEVLQSVPVRRGVAKFAYGNLKFPKDVTSADVDEILTKALDERTIISRAGLEKTYGKVALKKKAVDDLLARTPGRQVNWSIVEDQARNLQDIANKLGKFDEAKRIETYLTDFARAKGFKPATPPVAGTPATPPKQVPSSILGPSGQPFMKTIPGSPGTLDIPGTPAVPPRMNLTDANEAKRFLQDFATNIFGRDGLSITEKQLDALLSTGIKQAIEDVVPQVRAMNRDTQISGYLAEAIDTALKTSSHPLTRGEAIGLLLLPKATMAWFALSDPRIRTALVVAGDAFTRSLPKLGTAAGRVAASQFAPPIPELKVTP